MKSLKKSYETIEVRSFFFSCLEGYLFYFLRGVNFLIGKSFLEPIVTVKKSCGFSKIKQFRQHG